MKLFDNLILHMPKETIPREDWLYLGWVENYNAVLCYEEWEFRIYSYEQFDMNEIQDWGFEDEDWREWADNSFHWIDYILDKESCKYSKLELPDILDCVEIARNILFACDDELEYTSYQLYDMNDVPSERLVDFIRNWLAKMRDYKATFVYHYYK